MNRGIIVLLFALIHAAPILAQPSNPSPPSYAPLDGGLGLLLAAGAVYGVKKYRDSRN